MRARTIAGLAVLLPLAGCVLDGSPVDALSTFRVEVVSVNGVAPPASDAPLPANLGDVEDVWEVEIEARTGEGALFGFDGMVRITVEPGAVLAVEGDGAVGRNLFMRGGRAEGLVRVTSVYGPARLWVEDLGYLPADPGKESSCSNGVNDDSSDDVLIDYPADPGCAFANDDTEQGGTFAAGTSPPVHYALPRVSDIQGHSAQTPYPFEGIVVNTAAPQHVIVTRVASDGFYVTDLSEQSQGYNHLFAYNFNTPARMRVCDRVAYLAGTVNEFFGFTELSFPSYRLDFVFEGEACEVPEPVLLDAALIGNAAEMEKLESGLVRISGYHIAANFGKNRAQPHDLDPDVFVFATDQSNCDLNDDGQVDFEDPAETGCANQCSNDPECSEWIGYSARGNYKVSNGPSMVQINTGTVGGFDPTSHRGEVLDVVTGTLRNFSGGSLNWTIETRCTDDLVCSGNGCVSMPKPSSEACVRLRSLTDDDADTN
jgi:hypothetical protein